MVSQNAGVPVLRGSQNKEDSISQFIMFGVSLALETTNDMCEDFKDL